MPQKHEYTAVVTPTPAQSMVLDHELRTGRPWPHGRPGQLGYDWQVRDVTAGTDVATGKEDTEEEAQQQADAALEQARTDEDARLATELV